MSLAHVPFDTVVRVIGIRVDSPASCRLMEMGLVEGAQVQVLRRAPLGDPLHVRLGDYELSLRSSEAELVEVSPF